ncbi:helix-turn-helix domain-containing protein [Rhizobium sp. NPDC090275]|uniref:helix-turn-helix domain-containing protein n=1 Tax=Rhizobium sp. NPDC090275 TaxID=3364498 RepID=UPI00383B70A5
MSKLLLDTKETMEVLSVGKTKLFRMIKEGELSPVKMGGSLRFRVADLEAYVSGLVAA